MLHVQTGRHKTEPLSGASRNMGELHIRKEGKKSSVKRKSSLECHIVLGTRSVRSTGTEARNGPLWDVFFVSGVTQCRHKDTARMPFSRHLVPREDERGKRGRKGSPPSLLRGLSVLALACVLNPDPISWELSALEVK